MITPRLALLAVLAVSACSAPAPRAGISQAQTAACRQRSDTVYLSQNRATLYRADSYATSTRDAPMGGGLSQVPSSGLSERYAHDQLLDACLRSQSGNVGDSKAPPLVIQ
jgi:hypothetical protein